MESSRSRDRSVSPPDSKRLRMDDEYSSDGESSPEEDSDNDLNFDEFSKIQYYKSMVENSLNMMIEASHRDAELEAEAVSMAIKSHGLLFKSAEVPPCILGGFRLASAFRNLPRPKAKRLSNSEGKKDSVMNTSAGAADAGSSENTLSDSSDDGSDDNGDRLVSSIDTDDSTDGKADSADTDDSADDKADSVDTDDSADDKADSDEAKGSDEGLESSSDDSNPLFPINFSPCTSREEVLSKALSAAIKTKGLGASDRRIYTTLF